MGPYTEELKAVAVMLIAFEVRAPDAHRYIVRHIQSYSTWCRLAAGTFAVLTEKSARAVYSDVRRFLEEDDQLYVIGLTQPALGFGPESVNEWLESLLPTR